MAQQGELTPKQRRFVEEYLLDSNGTQAAIRAGYSRKTANEQSARLLAKASIRAAIEAKVAKLDEETEITVVAIRAGLWAIATDAEEPGNTRVAAYVALGRHRGMFIDKTEHSGKIDGPPVLTVVVRNATPTEHAT